MDRAPVQEEDGWCSVVMYAEEDFCFIYMPGQNKVSSFCKPEAPQFDAALTKWFSVFSLIINYSLPINNLCVQLPQCHKQKLDRLMPSFV